jgi:Chlorophyll A-B binding protein
MLAVIGYIVPEVYRFPGEIAPGVKFSDLPNGIAAIDKVPHYLWIGLFFLIGSIDFTGFLGSATPTGSQYFDSGFLSFSAGAPQMDPETLKTRTENEVSNGRLAMLAFWELIRHDYQNLYNPGMEPSDHMIVREALLPCAFSDSIADGRLASPCHFLPPHSKVSLSSMESKAAKRIPMQSRPLVERGSVGKSFSHWEFEAHLSTLN